MRYITIETQVCQLFQETWIKLDFRYTFAYRAYIYFTREKLETVYQTYTYSMVLQIYTGNVGL